MIGFDVGSAGIASGIVQDEAMEVQTYTTSSLSMSAGTWQTVLSISGPGSLQGLWFSNSAGREKSYWRVTIDGEVHYVGDTSGNGMYATADASYTGGLPMDEPFLSSLLVEITTTATTTVRGAVTYGLVP